MIFLWKHSLKNNTSIVLKQSANLVPLRIISASAAGAGEVILLSKRVRRKQESLNLSWTVKCELSATTQRAQLSN